MIISNDKEKLYWITISTDFIKLEEFEKLQKEVQKLKRYKKKRWNKNYGN